MTEDCGAYSLPPSAAGQLEPYGARIILEPTAGPLDPQLFLTSLLQDLAAACVASGASVIGHLKCLLHLPGGTLACNLTSVRGGAKCSPRSTEGTPALVLGQHVRLDLAVLVYGLPAPTIAGLVHDVLTQLLQPLAVDWSVDLGEATS
jgi:hypothetical protein